MKRSLLIICCGLLAAALTACSGNSPGTKLAKYETVSHKPGNVQAFMEAIETEWTAVKEAQAISDEHAGKTNEEVRRTLRDTARIVTVRAHRRLMSEFPTYYDWWLQDGNFSEEQQQWQKEHTQYGKTPGINWFRTSVEEEIGLRLDKVAAELGKSADAKTIEDKFEQYTSMCGERRAKRLARFTENKPQVLFTKFEVLRPSFFAYTEGLSDARTERNYFPGGELAMLTMDGIWAAEEPLIKDSLGVLRDPEIHFDGQHAVLAWKKSVKEDDFHIYELDLQNREIKQLTFGLGYADIEPTYLPDDNILFNSTRCGTAVDCWTTEVSNLYVCDRQGRYMRRIGFDQVHTSNPAVLDDGRVVYTRWDYNDRGQVWTQPLFQMNPDGTAQSEYYGMNSWFPTTSTHIRQIPGTRKIMATLTGHHTPQHGKLGIIDPEAGRDENQGVMMVAPYEKAEAVKVDAYGQYGDQFQYPYPLTEDEFLISYSPLGYYAERPINFGIYWMDIHGNRELLAADAALSCNTPELIVPRERPFVRASNVDYEKETGTYYVQNIYEGPGLEGIEKGAVKKLRVVEIEFRTAGIGDVSSSGPGGGAGNFCPPSVGNGAWDLKKIHGTVDVHPDGSVMFEAPARTPLYFQALDDKGFVIQTMRSWSTLMPGEMQSCVGCHEHKNSVPVFDHPVSMAMNNPVQKIEPFEGGKRTFSFIAEVQPILDRECISCHDGVKHEMSLSGELKVFEEQSRRKFSEAFVNLTHAKNFRNDGSIWLRGRDTNPEVNWISSLSEPTLLKPYHAGAATSNLIKRLENGHGGAKLTPSEIRTVATWIDMCVPFIGDYKEANNWTPEQMELYDYHEKKRKEAEAEEKETLGEYINSLALAK